MKLYQVYKLAIIAIFLSVLTACQTVNSSVGGYFDLDTDIQIDLMVDADINPDELGKASPLFIRMYELSSNKMMKRADFIEIYERDKEVLGADMVAVHKLKRLKPGENRTENIVLDKKTNYVALYAEFLEFKGSKFKLIIPVVANNVFRDSVVIRVSGNELIFDEEIVEEVDDTDSPGKDAAKAKSKTDKAAELF
ncbi:MAG: type VI secretion system lipoprotein TssJ [Gammaproteobacteria bacterium]